LGRSSPHLPGRLPPGAESCTLMDR